MVQMDHAALCWLLTLHYPEGQMAGWLEKLQEYNFEQEAGTVMWMHYPVNPVCLKAAHTVTGWSPESLSG